MSLELRRHSLASAGRQKREGDGISTELAPSVLVNL